MAFHYDEKGKIFTNVITKDAVPATIQSLTHRIHGCVHVKKGERVKDELDQEERFLAVTDAEIFDDQGNVLYKTGFFVINRDHIVWLIPDEEVRVGGVSVGGAE